MTQIEMDELVLRLISIWDHSFVLRGVIGIAGLAIALMTVLLLLRRRCHPLIALLWLFAGVFMAAFSCYPREFIVFAVGIPYMTRIRVIIGALSLLMLFITLESIRRSHLQERYALLWVATALVLFVAAAFPEVLALFRAVTGTEYATAVVAVAFTFLVLVAFHFSISMSASLSRQTRIAQRMALLEARVRDLEQTADNGEERKPS